MLRDLLAGAAASVVAVAIATAGQAHDRAPERPLVGAAGRAGALTGADISWPNCPKGMGIPQRRTQGKPLPRRSARFVVLGLTNGPAFTPNPCLTAQVAFARERGLWVGAYAVVTHPTRPQLRRYGDRGPRTGGHRARLFNTGWAQARYNLARLREVGLAVPAMWLDVEPVTAPAPWSPRPRANRAVVDGALAAYRAAGLRVGLYSVPSLWRQVLGSTAYGLPEWRSAGPTSRRAALARCRTGSFQGGPALVAQWWDRRRDHDVLCPDGTAALAPAGWFTH